MHDETAQQTQLLSYPAAVLSTAYYYGAMIITPHRFHSNAQTLMFFTGCPSGPLLGRTAVVMKEPVLLQSTSTTPAAPRLANCKDASSSSSRQYGGMNEVSMMMLFVLSVHLTDDASVPQNGQGLESWGWADRWKLTAYAWLPA